MMHFDLTSACHRPVVTSPFPGWLLFSQNKICVMQAAWIGVVWCGWVCPCATNQSMNVNNGVSIHALVCLPEYVWVWLFVSPTQQHIEQPCIEVAGASRVLAHTDSWAGCCPSDGGRAGLQVGHKWFQEHLGKPRWDKNWWILQGFPDKLDINKKGTINSTFKYYLCDMQFPTWIVAYLDLAIIGKVS